MDELLFLFYFFSFLSMKLFGISFLILYPMRVPSVIVQCK